MVYEFLGLLVESYGTWLLLQRLVDASKDSDIPKNVPFAFAINNRNTITSASLHVTDFAFSSFVVHGFGVHRVQGSACARTWKERLGEGSVY